jgi:hypothetical protein
MGPTGRWHGAWNAGSVDVIAAAGKGVDIGMRSTFFGRLLAVR